MPAAALARCPDRDDGRDADKAECKPRQALAGLGGAAAGAGLGAAACRSRAWDCGFEQYLKAHKAEMRTNRRPDKHINNNCANAKLRTEAGSTFLANAIWAIGLPRLPPFATEQREQRLSARDLEAVPEAIHSVLKWLHRLATALTEPFAAMRRAKGDIRTAEDLAWQWDNYILTARNWQRWQENLLRAYWSGVLHEALEEVSDML